MLPETPTADGTQASQLAPAPATRKGKTKQKGDQPAPSVLFALATGKNSPNGLPVLGDVFNDESDATIAAFRNETDYYKLQLNKVKVVLDNGKPTIVSTPADSSKHQAE